MLQGKNHTTGTLQVSTQSLPIKTETKRKDEGIRLGGLALLPEGGFFSHYSGAWRDLFPTSGA